MGNEGKSFITVLYVLIIKIPYELDLNPQNRELASVMFYIMNFVCEAYILVN